jgi:hypothetical protein
MRVISACLALVRATGADAYSRRWSVVFVPCLVVAAQHDGAPRLGHRLLDDYLAMVAARSRPNTVLATAFDLKVFFTVVGKDPSEVTDADVLSFIRAQRQPRRGVEVVRIEDGEAGLSARTIKRRPASVTGLFEYQVMRGVLVKNPVPHGLSTRSGAEDLSGPATHRATGFGRAVVSHRSLRDLLVSRSAAYRGNFSQLRTIPPRHGRSWGN